MPLMPMTGREMGSMFREVAAKQRKVAEVIEAALVNAGVLSMSSQPVGDFLSHRRVSFDIKLPFSYRKYRNEILDAYQKQVDEISKKLPFFEYINVSLSLVLDPKHSNGRKITI